MTCQKCGIPTFGPLCAACKGERLPDRGPAAPADGLAWVAGLPPSMFDGEDQDALGEDWMDYPLTTELKVPILVEMKDGTRLVMGNTNLFGGICGCCSCNHRLKDVARWASLGHLVTPATRPNSGG